MVILISRYDMEPLHIDFSDSATLSGKLKFMGITMFIIGLAGVVFCLVEKTYGFTLYLCLFYLIYGAALLTPYPYRISTKNKSFIKIDDVTIEYRITPFSLPKREDWKNLTGITIKPKSLYLETTDNKRRKINLSWISHRNVLLIKQAMRDYASSKNLKVYLINA